MYINIHNIHRKTPVLKSVFMFACENYKIFKNSFFYRTRRSLSIWWEPPVMAAAGQTHSDNTSAKYKLPPTWLIEFGHFVGLSLKGLTYFHRSTISPKQLVVIMMTITYSRQTFELLPTRFSICDTLCEKCPNTDFFWSVFPSILFK